MQNPTLIATPFAENGDKNTIPESVGAEPQNATMQAGFPPITQEKISTGGIPPERSDFNGILNAISQHTVFLNKGGRYGFDATFAQKIGGYDEGAYLILKNGIEVISKVNGNMNNPNTNMSGWKYTEIYNQLEPLITGNLVASGSVSYPEFSVFSTIKINGVPLKRSFNMRDYFFEKPKDFTWGAEGCEFWLDSDGVLQSNIEPSDYDVASKNNPIEYFVSMTGTDTGTNLGTDPLTPLRSITRALYLIQTNNIENAVIWMQEGLYSNGNTWGTTVSIASNVSIKVWNMSDTAPFNDTTGKPIILPTNDTTLTWSLHSNTTYVSTRSGTHAVVDESIKNRYGDASFYEKVESIDSCVSTAGTWFLDINTSKLYVHTLDNRKPDSSIQVYVNKTLGRLVTGNYTVYIENVWFYGGVSPLTAQIEAGDTQQTVFMNKCRFWYGAENGIATRGTSLNIMYECSACYNRDDGFNYHSEFGGVTRKPQTIEYKCVAYRNGQSWSPLVLTNQGSTTHDDSDIVRAGCTYFDNGRQCVTDVGNSRSWLMYCDGSASEKRFEGSYYSVFQCAAGKMWLDHCNASGHDYALACTSNGLIYVRNCNLYPSLYTAQSISKW